MVTIKITADTLTQITKFLSNRIRVTQIIDVSEMGDSIDLVLVLLKIPGPDYQALLEDVQWPFTLRRHVVLMHNYPY
jgi:hypothetical protein